jgi:hypothetical protein
MYTWEGGKKSSFHRIGQDTLFNTRLDTIYNIVYMYVYIHAYTDPPSHYHIICVQCVFDSILMRVGSSRKLF